MTNDQPQQNIVLRLSQSIKSFFCNDNPKPVAAVASPGTSHKLSRCDHVHEGVHKIVAGTNVTISPTSGLGDVTVNASSGGCTLAANGADDDFTWDAAQVADGTLSWIYTAIANSTLANSLVAGGWWFNVADTGAGHANDFFADWVTLWTFGASAVGQVGLDFKWRGFVGLAGGGPGSAAEVAVGLTSDVTAPLTALAGKVYVLITPTGTFGRVDDGGGDVEEVSLATVAPQVCANTRVFGIRGTATGIVFSVDDVDKATVLWTTTAATGVLNRLFARFVNCRAVAGKTPSVTQAFSDQWCIQEGHSCVAPIT